MGTFLGIGHFPTTTIAVVVLHSQTYPLQHWHTIVKKSDCTDYYSTIGGNIL